MTSATTVCRAVEMSENSEGRVEIQGILKVNIFLLFLPKFGGAIRPSPSPVPTALGCGEFMIMHTWLIYDFLSFT